MGSTYLLDIVKYGDGDSEQFTLVYGDLDEVTYVGKRAAKRLAGEADTEFELTFVEVEKVGESEPKRTVTRVTSSGRTVATVLTTELKAEKKQSTENPANDATPASNGQSAPLVAEKPEQHNF